RRGKNLGGDIFRLLARLDPAPDIGIDAWQVGDEIEGRLLAAGDPIRSAGHSHPSFRVRVTRGVPIAKCLLRPQKDRGRAAFSWSKASVPSSPSSSTPGSLIHAGLLGQSVTIELPTRAAPALAAFRVDRDTVPPAT